MGLAYNTYLNSNKIYGCKTCKAHLANHEDIISRVCSLPAPLRLASPGVSPPSPSHMPARPRSAAPPLANAVLRRGGGRSQNFRGQHGKAYLFNTVVNVDAGEPSERNMTTGRHIVRDITCRSCRDTVGWKYDKAFEATEKYKEGKFILEAELLCMVS